MGGRPNPFAAARLANRTQQEQGNSPDSGRHMSPNAIMNVRLTLDYVGTVPVQVRRRSVLETAAAARGVNDRTCCNLGITRQLFRSIGILGGHSTIPLGGGLVCPGD